VSKRGKKKKRKEKVKDRIVYIFERAGQLTVV
jgi:hypothetical protein